MRFVAIDVETANPDMASICQIGIAVYDEERLNDEWKSFVDPEDYFHPINISIHGITETIVHGAPALPKVAPVLCQHLNDTIAVCHTHFDRVAIQQALAKHGLAELECTWLDSARVARRTWEQCAWRGYGLAAVCQSIGYEFQHHDALEDAKAAGVIMIAAMKETGLSLNDWLVRVEQPIDPSAPSYQVATRRDGDPEGSLYGEVLAFTGALEIPRREAADMAAAVGCRVVSGVTRETTLLVVGNQDIRHLAGHKKSSKHRKAEKLASEGQSVRILREADFEKLVRTARSRKA